jgi:hypothetical protein
MLHPLPAGTPAPPTLITRCDAVNAYTRAQRCPAAGPGLPLGTPQRTAGARPNADLIHTVILRQRFVCRAAAKGITRGTLGTATESAFTRGVYNRLGPVLAPARAAHNAPCFAANSTVITASQNAVPKIGPPRGS